MNKSRRIEIGTLFFMFGLTLVSVRSGQVQLGPIRYATDPFILRVFVFFAFSVSAVYLLSALVGIFKERLVSAVEEYVGSHIPNSLMLPITTIYGAAILLVFSQGLIMGVAGIPWESIKLLTFSFGFVWLLTLGYSHVLRAYILSKSRARTNVKPDGPDGWLRRAVLKEVKRRRPPMSFSERLRQLAIPGLRTILYVTIPLALSLIASWILASKAPGILLIQEKENLGNLYLTMWQVQGGIAAIALPLLIVVIEFSKDFRQAAARRPEVLIQYTWVFPMIVFALTGTVRAGVDIALFAKESVFWTDFIVFIATIGFTVFAYQRMLSVLLSPLKMKNSSVTVIRSEMNKHLDSTIEKRVANASLFQKLDEMGVEYWPFSPKPDEEDKYVILKSPNLGILRDIHMGKLETFLNRLPWKEPRTSFRTDPEIETETPRTLPGGRHIWWMRQYGKSITNQDSGLMRLDRSMFDISSYSGLEVQLAQLVRVVNEDSGDELRLELSYLRDSLIDAIRDCKTGAVQDGLQMYEELVAAFLSKLKQWGSTYTKEQAIRESASLEGGWFEVQWIKDDLQEIIDMTMRTEHISVIYKVLYFPVHLALLALSHKDYYIFHQFLSWIPYYYVAGLRLTDSRAKDLVVGRCSMYLAATARYHITSDIERAITEEDIETGQEFAKGVVLVFNRLLKCAYDEKKMDHFKGFLDTVLSLFDFYSRENQSWDVERLESQLNSSALTQAQKSQLERQLKLKRKHVETAKQLKEMIDVMSYGLNAWLLYQYGEGKVLADEFKQWNLNFAPSSNLQQSWNRFYLATRYQDRDDFEWSHWESREQGRGVTFAGVTTFSVGFGDDLKMLFCLQCLQLMGKMDDGQRSAATIPHSHEIVSLAESESSPLPQILKQMEQDAGKWQTIVGEDSIKATQALRGVFDRAVAAQKEQDSKFLRAAQVSAERISVVKRDVVDAWKKNSVSREIVREYGNYEFVNNKPPQSKPFWGFNEIQPKDVYVDDTSVIADGWGLHFGRILASSEDESFVEKLITNLDEFDKSIPVENPVSVISAALDKLEKVGCKPVIFILNSWSSFAAVDKSGLFNKKEDYSGQGFAGHFRSSPVFDLHYRGDPVLVIVDLKKFGVWRQFKPVQVFAEEEYISDELTFCVRPFTEITAKETIKQSPKLMLNKEGNPRPEADVLSELQLKVHFRLVEQYELVVRDKASGYKVPAQL